MKLCNICGAEAHHSLEKVYVNEVIEHTEATKEKEVGSIVPRVLYDATGKDLCPTCLSIFEKLVEIYLNTKAPLSVVVQQVTKPE